MKVAGFDIGGANTDLAVVDFENNEVKNIEEYFSNTIPLGRTATIEEVSSAYIFLIENSFINGQTLKIDGGLTLL